MKKWSLAIAFTAIFSLGAFAQVQPFQDANGKWGVKNNGTVIVQPQYNYIDTFSEGIATVQQGSNYGTIDASGNLLVPVGKYLYINKYSEGLAAVSLNGKYGFIDKSGKEVIPLQYNYAGSFYDGLALAEVKGKAGFINKSGQVAIPLNYGHCRNFSEGLASVAVDGWWDGDIYADGKWGVVDKTGKETVVPKYDYVGPFHGGVAEVNMGGAWEYDDYEMPSIYGGKWGLINKTGQEILPLQYDYIITDYCTKYGYIIVNTGSKFGLLNSAGTPLTPVKYDFIKPSNQPDIALVNIGGKYDEIWGGTAFNPYSGGSQGFINFKTGKEITPVQYANVGDFNEGLAMVNMGAVYDGAGYQGGKWGYIDAAGKTIIPLKYDTADYFFDGKAKVSMGGREFYIDKTGKEVK